MRNFKLSCVLFDLDGTLVDTAPDLLACLDIALLQYGFAKADPAQVKPFISYGAAAMIDKSLDDDVPETVRALLLTAMLDGYQRNIAKYSRFFEGMPDILANLEARGLKWGVVTNKRERFTQPLMAALNLSHRAACIISGDTTANPKPHVEPMLAACKQAQTHPLECVYIGDACHDITAGKAAQMKTLAALYGYLKPSDTPETWGADALIATPKHLANWIDAALCH